MPTKIPVMKKGYMTSLVNQLGEKEVQDIYRKNNEFLLEEDGLISNTHLVFDTEVPSLTVESSKSASERAASDAQNAEKVHSFFYRLTPMEAGDFRLWSYLTHGPYFKYSQARWPCPHESQKAQNHIKEHWFYYKGGLRRNAISRLWLAGHLTHEPWRKNDELSCYENGDPYHYTKILLSNQQVFQDLVERDYGNSLKVRICVLDVLDTVVPMTPFMVRFSKDLNLIASHTDLESMNLADLKGTMKGLVEKITKK
jgi:hypothetical protein